ncbi:MAG: glycogen/starch synthase [Candidatus Omnitrophica bacterium]|nr:glycogen/starch synthase [Candidatus Omnitrophota bacterium]
MLKKRPVGHKTAIFLITALFLINSASYGIDLSNDNISQPLVFAKDSPAQESEIFRNKILLDWRQRAVFLSITSHYLIDKGNNADLVNALREKLRGVEEHYKDLPVWREAPDGNALAVRIFYTADDVDCIATVTRKTVEGAEKYVISVEKDSTSDLKGRDAPASDPLIQKLIEEHSVVEVYIDPASGALNAARLKPVEDYRPMETPSVLYRGEGIDIFQLFTRSQQKILADLMKKHRVRGSPVKFRIVLGNAALGWSEDEALNSNIAHAGIYDGVIYCGGTLLKELLNGRNGDLREAIIVDDEFAHLQGYDHAMDESYQARLAAVSSLIAREELESIARAMRENDVTFLIDRLRARLEEPLKLLSMLAILNEVSLSQPDHPVESRYPIKTAASLLDKEEQSRLLEILLSEESKMEGYREQIVVDELILMFADAGTLKVEFKDWIRVHAPELEGRSLWQISPEIWHEAGGLARVMQYHGTAILKLIGLSDVRFRQIEPHYQKRVDPDPSKPSKPLDYTDPGQVAHPIQGPLIESDHFTVSVGGKDIDVVVNVGVNDLGIEVCLIRDVQPDGSSFFTDSLYNYRQSWEHGKRLPTWEEFSVFYSKAALEFVRRVEAKEKVEKEEAGFEWKAPVLHLNDSQTALVSVYRKIWLDIGKNRHARDPECRLDPVLEGAVICFTTHTYGNRTQYGTRDGYGDGILDFMEIPAKYRRLFERDNWKIYDMASAGLRSSDWQGVVAWAHCKDVRDNDEWVSDHGNRAALELEAAMDDPTLRVDLVAVTNGDHRSNTAVVFREHLRDLFGENVDWEHSSPDQIIEVKKAAKRALRVSGNKAYYTSKDQSESGGRILDPDQLVVSYSGRLVPEKTGRGYDGMGSDGRGAFDNDNIRWLVARGVQVVIYGNVQAGNPTSDEMARRLMDLAEELKGWTAHGVGRLVFVPRFSLTDERVLKAASDMGVHDSFPGTEAAGFTESNDAAAGGLVMAPLRAGKHYNDGTGEGLFEAQGLRLDMDNPGHGNTFVPETLDSGGYMSAPSKANVSKLDNPARVTANHRHGTEPCV